MASLTGKLVAETYKALLKTIDNDILIASEKQITDGLGGGSGIFIDSQGFLRANKFIVTNGTASQFLKGNGTLDSNTYLTGITSSQETMALGFTPVTNQRILTINNVSYDLSQNRTWTLDSGGGTWGGIVGTLSNQTDLQASLDAKYDNPTGTILDYIRGDGSIAPFTNSASQTKNEVKLGAALSKGTPVYVSSANGTNIIVSASSNTTEATSSKTFGLLETGGALNDIVECVTFGLIDGLDTSAASAGDPVWLGANGTLLYGLANKPYAPAHMVYIGVVTRSQSNNGEIFVNVQNGFELDELHNVSARTPSNNHGIFYETSTSLWKNKSIDDALGYTPQRLDKMVSNLLASDTEYPNSNAVIAKLNLKANIENPEFTGSMNITGIESRINFYDQYSTRKFFIGYNTGTLSIYQDTGSASRFYINSSGKTFIPGDLEIGTISKSGGTSSQFFKADGSIDSTAYAPTSTLSNYLLVTTAASTYQRIDKMVSNLLASDTEYPNSNAVLAKLALKANAENPSFTGYMTITGAEPKLYFTDTDQNPDYFIGVDAGFIRIYDQTAGATRFVISPTGVTTIAGDLIVGSVAKSGGTSSQFLKADGSIDSSSYVSSGTLANYLLISTATSTYQRLDKMVSNLLASDTEYPNSNAVLAKLALKADAADPVFTGNLTISGISPRLYFTDTDNNPDYTIFVDSGYFYIYDQTAGATKFQITPSGNAINTGTITASSFIKAGGSSSQYLMADGSVSSGSGIGGSGTSGYHAKWTSSNSVGDGVIYDNGSNIGIRTTSAYSPLTVQSNTVGWGESATFYPASSGYITIAFRLQGSSDYTGTWALGKQSNTSEGTIEYLQIAKNGLTGSSLHRADSVQTWHPNGNALFGFNVGIGTIAPDARLHVQSASVSYGQIRFLNTTSSGEATIHIGRTNQTLEQRWTFGAGPAGIGDNFGFYTGGSNRFVITTAGNIGIGTNNPSVQLNVQSGSASSYTGSGPGDGIRVSSGNTNVWMSTVYNGTTAYFGSISDNTVKFAGYNYATSTNIKMEFGQGAMYIAANNNVGIGNASPLAALGKTLTVEGTIISQTGAGGGNYNENMRANRAGNGYSAIAIGGAYGTTSGTGTGQWTLVATPAGVSYAFDFDYAGTTVVKFSTGGNITGAAFFESSDMRIKTLIDGSPQIAGIENLEAKLYEKNGKVEFGYFAQDAEKYMPYAVEKNPDGFLSLSYREVHTAKIARLEKRVAELEKQLNLN